jgi:hypothetical protein
MRDLFWKIFRILVALSLWAVTTLVLTFLIGRLTGVFRPLGGFPDHIPTIQGVMRALVGLIIFAFPLLSLATCISAGIVAAIWFGCGSMFRRLSSKRVT